MTPREANIDAILADAANDLRIPTEVAQQLLRIGAELARQHQEIVDLTEELRQAKARHDTNVANLNKRLDKYSGVHGA